MIWKAFDVQLLCMADVESCRHLVPGPLTFATRAFFFADASCGKYFIDCDTTHC
jgi:hypothetical protein